MVKLRAGNFCYIEVPNTTLEPPQYRKNDIYILIHKIVHTFNFNISEPSIVPYQDEQINNSIEVDHIDLYKDPMTNNTTCKVQPFRKLAFRIIKLLTYRKKTWEFWRIFIFKTRIFSTLTKINSVNVSLGTKTILLHNEIMPEKILVRLGLDWILMLNCKRKDLPKFLFIAGKMNYLMVALQKRNSKTFCLNI